MVLDASDARATMSTYGASGDGRPPATHFAPCEYARFYDSPPQQVSSLARTWYVRGQNFVLAYSQVQPGAEFARPASQQPDEYVVLLPDRDGAAIDISTDAGASQAPAYSISFVPPGASSLRVTSAGHLVQLFSTRAADLLDVCSNAASYAQPHPNVAPLDAWPDPPGGFRLRTYSLDVPPDPTRFGRIFRCTNFMVNFSDGSSGPRDTAKMSPHSHDDFEQCSLVLRGEYVHHIRFPWTSNLVNWLEDDHTRIGSPSVAIIPPPSIHTSQGVGAGVNQLIDIFSPPRFDFSEKDGWVLNAADYPMP